LNGDVIRIEGLELRCRVGVQPRERKRPRRIVVDLAVERDLRRAGDTDDLADTVDYAALCARVADRIVRRRFSLIEALAACAARACLEVAKVRGVTVVVRKPGALRNAREVTVCIRRARGGRRGGQAS